MNLTDIVADLTKGVTDAAEALENTVEGMMSPAEADMADMPQAEEMDHDDMEHEDMDEEAMEQDAEDDAPAV